MLCTVQEYINSIERLNRQAALQALRQTVKIAPSDFLTTEKEYLIDILYAMTVEWDECTDDTIRQSLDDELKLSIAGQPDLAAWLQNGVITYASTTVYKIWSSYYPAEHGGLDPKIKRFPEEKKHAACNHYAMCLLANDVARHRNERLSASLRETMSDVKDVLQRHTPLGDCPGFTFTRTEDFKILKLIPVDQPVNNDTIFLHAKYYLNSLIQTGDAMI